MLLRKTSGSPAVSFPDKGVAWTTVIGCQRVIGIPPFKDVKLSGEVVAAEFEVIKRHTQVCLRVIGRITDLTGDLSGGGGHKLHQSARACC